MRAVVETDPGVLELNFMWLPTWIGMNSGLKKEIEEYLGKIIVGREMTEAVLDEAHDLVVAFLMGRFPEIHGLPAFLDGLRKVQ